MFFDDSDFWVDILHTMEFIDPLKYSRYENGFDYFIITCRRNPSTVLEFNNKKIKLEGNCLSFVPPGTSYTRHTTGDNWFSIHFLTSGKCKKEIKIFYPENFEKYENAFKEIYRIWNGRQIGYHLKCNEKLTRLLYDIYCEQLNSKSLSLSEQATQLIDANIGNVQFNINSLAQSLNISGAYLRKKFNERYGISPKQYLMQSKMNLAVSLLETHCYTIKQISELCGFCNDLHFTTTFKKYYGLPPSQYQKRGNV